MLKQLPRPITKFLLKTRLYKLIHPTYRKYTKISLKEKLEQLTSNKDLQALLSYHYPDYGPEPQNAPFLMHAMLQSHYLNGAYYPRGGPSQIPNKIIPVITKAGGQVLTKAPVKRIVVDENSNKAVGVELEDGKIIHSKIVISDAGFRNTFTKLLSNNDDTDGNGVVNGSEKKKKNNDDPTLDINMSTTGISLFVGLKGDAKSLNLPKTNAWIHPTNDLSATADRIRSMTLEDAISSNNDDKKECFSAKDMVLFVGCPSTKDSSWAERHPNQSTLEIITMIPYSWFERYANAWDTKARSHGPTYEQAKTILAEKMYNRVVEVLGGNKDGGAILPETLQDVDHYEVGTPLTFAHYYNSPEGAWYGLDMNLERFQPENFFLKLRPKVPGIKNLYMTGQDVMTDGLIGAAFGGVTCACSILGVVFPNSLLRNIKKDRKKKKQQKKTLEVEKVITPPASSTSDSDMEPAMNI